jgi:hypothetical protein
MEQQSPSANFVTGRAQLGKMNHAFRTFNLAFWLWFALSSALNPIEPGHDYWPAFAAQFFQLGNYGAGDFLGRLILVVIPWFLIDRRFRRKAIAIRDQGGSGSE